MTKTLLYIRSRQLNRESRGLGLYTLVFIALAAVLSFIAYYQFKNSSNAWYIIVSLAIICLGIQYGRKDKSFIYKQLDKPRLQIFFEYLILCLPFSVTSIFTKNWFYFPLLLLVLAVIPFFRFEFKYRAVFKNLSSVIPASNYEWISGSRKHYLSLICLYSVALTFSWVRILPLFLLWILTTLIASFFLENEPIQILREGNKTARKFLTDKLVTNIRYILILYSLPIIINAVFVNEFLTLTLLFIPTQIALLGLAICLKYSTYKPNTNILGNSIAFSIVAILSAMPYFLPIPIILAIVYFYKAEKNLKQYLHD